MIGLHKIVPTIDPQILMFCAALKFSDSGHYPEMRFRLTGQPLDLTNRSDEAAVEYFHRNQWVRWTNHSLFYWNQDIQAGYTQTPTDEQMRITAEAFE